MTVNQGVRKVLGEPPGALELRLGRSHSESRRDRVQQSLATMPRFQQLTRVTLAGPGGVAQILRAVAIHQHLACRHTHAACRGRLEERLHGGTVNAAEDHRRRRAVAYQLIEEELGNLLCVRRVREPALGRKRVVLQPVKQLPAA